MPSDSSHNIAFPPTRWSLVLSSTSENKTAALDELSRLYWSPLYVFCRRRGLSQEDAEDITQRFFHDLVKSNAAFLDEASPSGGRLRTLFLRILQRRIVEYHRHTHREKRGGGSAVFSLDAADAEQLVTAIDPAASPEEAFDRQWALNVLELALARQEKEFAASGRQQHFAVLAPFLGLTNSEPDYTAVEQSLGVTAATARQTVLRFRDRFRRYLREEIAETIADTDEHAIDVELAELQSILREAAR
jgi:RNA polymerase sigma factor (sigma-70 family)